MKTIRLRGSAPSASIWIAMVLAWPGLIGLIRAGETVAPGAPRRMVPLSGPWLFRQDGSPTNEWRTVTVPSSFERHEGIQFDGVGWYRKTLPPLVLPANGRVLLHFQAAATEAEVWWNDETLGSHLGGWTPFRFDITEQVRRVQPGDPREITVRLDEKVGHNTQGFLPIIAPHFGGLWQEVKLVLVPDAYFDDLRLLAVGDPDRGELAVDMPIVGGVPEETDSIRLRGRLLGESNWRELSPTATLSGSLLSLRAAWPDFKRWSPSQPNLYEVEVALPGPEGDRIRTRAAFRSITVWGPQFRLNGQPLNIRGLLNWGYSPPQTDPNAGEAVWRRELEMARERGFNLMKFCLWIPPQGYLDLADEMGMLAWMEYPTWHPSLTQDHLPPLRQEFREFFAYDRNHPSVILRSLTCETGPSAELPVIRELYDMAHTMVPGAVVVDDSSWISWNRVHDFYDDHPYGNNHTWVPTLLRLNQYILGHGLKPLALGEAIAADTWVDRSALVTRLGEERPWWAPGPLDDMARWQARLSNLAGPGGMDQLRSDSLRYGLLMRKYQAEAFRWEVPYGGYVMSVIRDIPNASMGFIDYVDQPKWRAQDWDWQRDTICLLQTVDDTRSFTSGGTLQAQILVSHFGPDPIDQGRLRVTLETNGVPAGVIQHIELGNLTQGIGTVAAHTSLHWPLPEVSAPLHLVVRAELLTSRARFHNHWPVWVVPRPQPNQREDIQVHPSLSSDLVQALFPSAESFHPGLTNRVTVAARFDDELVRFLEQGGRVLLLPDNQKNSLPLRAHWFLRGAPYVPDHGLSGQIPRDMLVELQHFDLAGDVIPEVAYLDAVDPILMLWDTHDLRTVKTHALLFQTQAAQGRLLVSALRHQGGSNAAGRWLLDLLLRHLQSGPPPRQALPPSMWAHLKTQLHAETMNLVEKVWQFRPDPANEGLAKGWHQPDPPGQESWSDIRIGQSWESQGYPTLDYWAWYRLETEVPAAWANRDIYLSFEGVDDLYELYVNGHLAGKGGDLATRQDAFNERKRHNITPWVKPGTPVVLAVRVHDWYGAGGIFRPVTLGTIGFNPGIEMLK